MDYKPKDLFLSAIDIFAIFFPGAILLYLRQQLFSLLLWKTFHITKASAEFWVVFVILAYLIGQVLIFASIFFDPLEDRFRSRKFWNQSLFQYASDNIPQEGKKVLTRRQVFYRVYSYLRLYSPSALAEIEKQSADNKLFRSLALVCLVDVVFSGFSHQWVRLGIGLVLIVVCLLRFLYLRSFNEMIAYEYYYLMDQAEKKGKQKPQLSGERTEEPE